MNPVSATDILTLQSVLAWAVFALAMVLGAVMQRSNFCTMGAVSDIVNMGDWTRMRMWVCAIAVATLGTQSMAALGWIDLSKSIYTAGKMLWLSNLLGGVLFGLGMVLASGCGSKTLVRIGGGSLKSLVVFITLGLFAYMTLKGLFAVLRVASVDQVMWDLGKGQDLPTLLFGATGTVSPSLRLTLAALVALPMLIFAFSGKEFRRAESVFASVLIGLVVVTLWYLSGKVGYIAEDPDSLQERFLATNSGKLESFSFVSPIAYTLELLMFWSDKSKIVTLGIAAVLGMVAGSWVMSVLTKQFRWEGFRDAEDTANHLAGAALMGVGGVTALGCTVGQGLSGVSTLAVGSFISFAGIVLGAMVAFRYQTWRIEKTEL
jgi:uncharacterized protein